MIKKILLIIIVLGLTGCKKENEEKRSEKTEKKSLKNDTTVYNISDVDNLPKYVGNIDDKLQAYIKKNYVKSEEIIREEIQAGIFAKVIIEKDGSLSNIEIIRDFGYGSGNELVRVLKLCPKLTPAMKDGQAVRCLYTIRYYVLIED